MCKIDIVIGAPAVPHEVISSGVEGTSLSGWDTESKLRLRVEKPPQCSVNPIARGSGAGHQPSRERFSQVLRRHRHACLLQQ